MKGRNVELGTIPISTPHLSKMAKMVNKYYIGLNDNEILALQKEIHATTDNNCNADVCDIACMLQERVDGYVTRYLTEK